MIKQIAISILILFISFTNIYSQNSADSLVHFSDLKFHSDFERTSFLNFYINHTDTFNLFLAIDKDMNPEKSKEYYYSYQSVYDDLKEQKVFSKDINKKIKIIYTTVHEKYLKKYNEIEFLPGIFNNSSYNCVSASVVYSLIFTRLKIPYKIMASSNHVYLIANPEFKPVVVETTNPLVEKEIFSDKFTKAFVKNLKDSKLISENDYKEKGAEQIYEETLNKVDEISLSDLYAFQYFNLGILKLQSNEYKQAYQQLQKAYFIKQDPKIKLLLYASLAVYINKCTYEEISDIDFLAQFSRFNDEDIFAVPRTFFNALQYFLQYTDKLPHCDSLYNRLTSQITNKGIREETQFAYYAQLCIHFQSSENLEFYAFNALKLKPNHKAAKASFEYAIQKKYEQIHENQELLDTIQALRTRYNIDTEKKLFDEYEMIAILGLAFDFYKNKKPEQGEEYLQKFEKNLVLPIENRELLIKIVDAYRVKAEYYSDKNKIKEREALEKAIKLVPNSSFIKLLIKEKGYDK